MKMRAVSVFLGLFLIVAAATAGTQVARRPSSRPAVLGDNPDAPRILAFDVTPKTLKNNRINFIQLYLKFSDEMANLHGGDLNINFIYESASGEPLPSASPAAPGVVRRTDSLRGASFVADAGRPTFVVYPLAEPVFLKKTGEIRLRFGLLAENFSAVTINAWLMDGAGVAGFDNPQVTLVRSTAPSGPKQGRKIGQLAYDFTLLDKAEKRRTLSTYRGKVVLIDFCTMWCGPCKLEAAELQALYLKYRKRGFVVLNVLTENYAGNPIRPSDCKTWADAYQMTFPVLADLFWGVFNPYYGFPNTRSIPNNVLIDKTGKIRWKKAGYAATIKAQMEAKIQQLLAE